MEKFVCQNPSINKNNSGGFSKEFYYKINNITLKLNKAKSFLEGFDTFEFQLKSPQHFGLDIIQQIFVDLCVIHIFG